MTAYAQCTGPNAVNATVTILTPVSCNGDANGRLRGIASGGTGPYTYSWSPDGSTAATISALRAGTYTFTATDANGCRGTASATLTEPPPVLPNATILNHATYGNCDGRARSTPSGGVVPYTYAWSGSGGTGATILPSCKGNYTVTATDANGCSGSQSVRIGEPHGAPSCASGNPTAGQVVIGFCPPSTDGLLTPTIATAACNPGGLTGSSSGNPITITGLASSTVYSCTLQWGNAAGLGPARTFSFTSSDTVAPSVASVSVPAAGNYLVGSALDFVVTFNEAMAITGSPMLGVIFDTGAVTATLLGSTATTATFRYVVGTTDRSVAGILIGALQLNGGTLRDTGGNDADLTLNAVGSTAGITVNLTPPGAPTITSIQPILGGALVSYNASGNNGGTPVTGFRAVCGPGSVTSASMLISPIQVNGLANGNTYSCVVIATNARGDSAPSAAQSVTLPATVVSSVARAGVDPAAPGATLAYTVTFSRAVTGVDVGDFAVVGGGTATGTVSGVTGSGTTYTVTMLAGAGGGTLRLDVVDDDSIVDVSGGRLGGPGAGNGNFTGAIYSVGGVPASPAIGAATPGNGQAMIAFTPGSDGGYPILGYRASCTPGPVVSAETLASPITIALTNGATYSCVVIARNSQGDSAPSASVGVALGVTGVASITRAAASPTASASVAFTVTFTRPVTGVDAADFTLVTTGTLAGAAITGVTGSGTTYTVTASTGTGSGTLRLDLIDDDSITDGSAPLGGIGAGNGNFTMGQVYTIDRGGPQVVSFTRVGPATIAPFSTQQFQLVFDKPVTGVAIESFGQNVSGFMFVEITGVTGSGTTYLIGMRNRAGHGEFYLSLQSNAAIVDALGNAFAGLAFSERYTVTSSPMRTFSGPSTTGSGTVTAEIEGLALSCGFATAELIPLTGHPRSPPAGSAPPGTPFPHGLFDFTLTNCGPFARLVITYPGSVEGLQYWKYGPTPSNATPHWYVLPSTMSGNTARFELADGGLGDDDLVLNGTIVDQGGPGGLITAAAIPTLLEWAMIVMGLLLLGFAAPALRRRG